VRKDHPQCWECIPCKTPGRVPLVFPSVDDLLRHVKQLHNDMIKESQYQTLVESAAAPAPTGISQCPLCDETGAADSEPLLNHIAEHMHEFALRSLPWPRDPDADDNSSYPDYYKNNDYFDEGSDEQSRQYNVSDGSEKSSGGLPSLPSDGSFELPSLGDEITNDTSLDPGHTSSDASKPLSPEDRDLGTTDTGKEAIGNVTISTRSQPPECPAAWRDPDYIPFNWKGEFYLGQFASRREETNVGNEPQIRTPLMVEARSERERTGTSTRIFNRIFRRNKQ
jgi:hypothetical protein